MTKEKKKKKNGGIDLTLDVFSSFDRRKKGHKTL